MEISIAPHNTQISISVKVESSLKASLLADRLNALPYLKVNDRHFEGKTNKATIKAYTIKGIFNVDKLHIDLENMSDLYINEPIKEETDNDSL